MVAENPKSRKRAQSVKSRAPRHVFGPQVILAQQVEIGTWTKRRIKKDWLTRKMRCDLHVVLP